MQINRLDLYLNENTAEFYQNTAAEEVLLQKFTVLYERARSAQQNDPELTE